MKIDELFRKVHDDYITICIEIYRINLAQISLIWYFLKGFK